MPKFYYKVTKQTDANNMNLTSVQTERQTFNQWQSPNRLLSSPPPRLACALKRADAASQPPWWTHSSTDYKYTSDDDDDDDSLIEMDHSFKFFCPLVCVHQLVC